MGSTRGVGGLGADGVCGWGAGELVGSAEGLVGSDRV